MEENVNRQEFPSGEVREFKQVDGVMKLTKHIKARQDKAKKISVGTLMENCRPPYQREVESDE